MVDIITNDKRREGAQPEALEVGSEFSLGEFADTTVPRGQRRFLEISESSQIRE